MSPFPLRRGPAHNGGRLNRESATGAVFDFDNESSVTFTIKGVTANATYCTSK